MTLAISRFPMRLPGVQDLPVSNFFSCLSDVENHMKTNIQNAVEPLTRIYVRNRAYCYQLRVNHRLVNENFMSRKCIVMARTTISV